MDLHSLLKQLIESNGSDLHIMAGLKPAIRINRQIMPIEDSEPLDAEQTRNLLYGILSEEQIQQFEYDPKFRYDLDFAYSIRGLGRFRVNLYKQRGTVAATIRAMAETIPTLEECRLPELVRDFTRARRGLILVTGPAGMGKSTTIAALINHMNEERPLHIITIEDPIEYLHNSKKSYVSQREVGHGADTPSYKIALQQAIRQDPDVIQVGNLESVELVELVLTAADNGILVIGAMPTLSACQTIARMIDIFPTEKESQILTGLADHLVGIVSQLLLPRADKQGLCLACEIFRTNTVARATIRHNRLEGIYPTLVQSMDQAFTDLAEQNLIDYETVQPYIRSDMTHRQIQTLLGIRKPMSHRSSHFTPLPTERGLAKEEA